MDLGYLLGIFAFILLVQTASTDKEVCQDEHASCKQWKQAGFCLPSSDGYEKTVRVCRATCLKCIPNEHKIDTALRILKPSECKDKITLCSMFKIRGFCTSEELIMSLFHDCCETCFGERKKQLDKKKCSNKFSNFACALWAMKGHCIGEGSAYMSENCCQACRDYHADISSLR